MRTEFQAWLEAIGSEVEAGLRESLENSSLVGAPEGLREAVTHALLSGGKRVRPGLCLLAAEVCGVDRKAAMPAAVAVEMVHAYSLVHDDLPCMDDDLLRRGRPTVHAAFGEATAVLAGDALQALAFEVLARQPDSTLAVRQSLRLARAAGPAGMVGGQQLDMQLEGAGASASLAEVEQVHAGKTGMLVAHAFLLGVDLAMEDAGPWGQWALLIGRLFQATDDILDATRSTQELGKTAGKDNAAEKATLIAVLGLEGARGYAEDIAAQAQDLIPRLPMQQRSVEIAALPTYLLERCR
ncbi:MAG: polyprenyl synthetase family protein [Planctomycetes bacterium]|nr:polyprenyl synthetase family protein [Planctomycetota bacterium]